MPEAGGEDRRHRHPKYRDGSKQGTGKGVPPGSELIIVARRGPQARLLKDLAGAAGADVRPLFGDLPQRLQRHPGARGQNLPDLSRYYTVDAPVERFTAIAAALRRLPSVETVYIKPPVDLPWHTAIPCPPLAAVPPAVTPDFTSRQRYLNAAPGGINARFAWTIPGGRGYKVWIIDVERAWNFTHEDLLQNQGGVIGGTPPITHPDFQKMVDHGTACVGILSGDRNNRGIVGICPEANLRAVSTFGATGSERTAPSIMQATAALRPGDIMLLELHRSGPANNFQEVADRSGYIAVEWFEDDFDAILTATQLGIIVVEAAGNGWENLDDGIYDTPHPDFSSRWRNPFRRQSWDSGAILVGAGAPPVGSHGVDRSRLDFSNYGMAVDAQGWGYEVTTTGYGCLQGGSSQDRWYSHRFGGTSGATPMVAGALACLQGILRQAGLALLTPTSARDLLRLTGSPQPPPPAGTVLERIGSRPNLKAMLAGLARRRGYPIP
jgi:subtilisin family serine protease